MLMADSLELRSRPMPSPFSWTVVLRGVNFGQACFGSATSASGANSGLLLAFHLRQTFFQSRHEIDHGSHLLGLLDLHNFSAFQLGLDQLFQVFLEFVVVFVGVPAAGKRLNQLIGYLD